MKTNKKKIIILITFTALLILLLLILAIKLTFFKREHPIIKHESNSNETEYQKEINIKEYTGRWKKSQDDEKYILISTLSENIIIDLSGMTNMNLKESNIKVENGVGNFETESYEKNLKIYGNINFEKSKIILKITKSDVEDIKPGFYNFEYKENVTFD